MYSQLTSFSGGVPGPHSQLLCRRSCGNVYQIPAALSGEEVGMTAALSDFAQILQLAHCISLLRGSGKGREVDDWLEAADFWLRLLMAEPLRNPRRPRLRPSAELS